MGCCGGDLPSPLPSRRIGDIMQEKYRYSPESKSQRKIFCLCIANVAKGSFCLFLTIVLNHYQTLLMRKLIRVCSIVGEPLRYDPTFKGPLAKRSCTDIICLLIFVIFLCGWGFVAYFGKKSHF